MSRHQEQRLKHKTVGPIGTLRTNWESDVGFSYSLVLTSDKPSENGGYSEEKRILVMLDCA